MDGLSLTEILWQEAREAIDELEKIKALDSLKGLLGYLKKTIKLLDPDYDVTQDPT